MGGARFGDLDVEALAPGSGPRELGAGFPSRGPTNPGSGDVRWTPSHSQPLPQPLVVAGDRSDPPQPEGPLAVTFSGEEVVRLRLLADKKGLTPEALVRQMVQGLLKLI